MGNMDNTVNLELSKCPQFVKDNIANSVLAAVKRTLAEPGGEERIAAGLADYNKRQERRLHDKLFRKAETHSDSVRIP